MKTNIKSLKLKRLSSLPNRFGSYAYSVEEAAKPEVAELLDGVEGVYDGAEDGQKLIYSRNRVGGLNKVATVNIRLQESQKDGQPTGNWYINAVDTSLEAFGEFADKVKLAERFGIKDASAAVSAFYGTKTAAPVAAEPVGANAGADQPLMENK